MEDRDAVEAELDADFQGGHGCARVAPFALEHHVAPATRTHEKLRECVPGDLYTIDAREVRVVSERKLACKLGEALRTTLLSGVEELHVEPMSAQDLERISAHLSAPRAVEHAYGTAFRRAMIERGKLAELAEQITNLLKHFHAAAEDFDASVNALFWQQFLSVASKRAYSECTQMRRENQKLSVPGAFIARARREFEDRTNSLELAESPAALQPVEAALVSPSTTRLSRADFFYLLQRVDSAHAIESRDFCACVRIASRGMHGATTSVPFEHAPLRFSARCLFPHPGTHGSAQTLAWTYSPHASARSLAPPASGARGWHGGALTLAQFRNSNVELVHEMLAGIPGRAPDGSYVFQVMQLFVRKNTKDHKHACALADVLDHDPEVRSALLHLDTLSVSYYYARRYAASAVAELEVLHESARDRVDDVVRLVERICTYGKDHRAYPLLQTPYSKDGVAAVPLRQAGLAPQSAPAPMATESGTESTAATTCASTSHLVQVHALRAVHQHGAQEQVLAEGLALAGEIWHARLEATFEVFPDTRERLTSKKNRLVPSSLNAFYRFVCIEVMQWQLPEEQSVPEYALNPLSNAVLIGVDIPTLLRAQQAWARGTALSTTVRCSAVFEALGISMEDRKVHDSRMGNPMFRYLWHACVPGLFLACMYLFSNMPIPLKDRDSRLASGFFAATASACTPYDPEIVKGLYLALGRAILGVDCNGRVRPSASDDELLQAQVALIQRRAPLLKIGLSDPFRPQDTRKFDHAVARLHADRMLHGSDSDSDDNTPTPSQPADRRTDKEDYVDSAHRLLDSLNANPKLETAIKEAREVIDAACADFAEATPAAAPPVVESMRGAESLYFYTMSQYDFNRTFHLRADVPETDMLRTTRLAATGAVRDWSAPTTTIATAATRARVASTPPPFSATFNSGAATDYYDCAQPTEQLHAAPCANCAPYRAGRIALQAEDTYLCDENGVATVLTDIEGDPGYWKHVGACDDMMHGTRMITSPRPGAFENVRRGDLIVIRVARANVGEREDVPERRRWALQNRDKCDKFLCNAVDYCAWDFVDTTSLRAGNRYCYVAVVHAVVPHAHVSIPLVHDDLESFRSGALVVSRCFPIPGNFSISPAFLDQASNGLTKHATHAHSGVVHHVPGAALRGNRGAFPQQRLAMIYKILYEAIQTQSSSVRPPGVPAYNRTAGTQQLVPWYDCHAAARGIAQGKYDSLQITRVKNMNIGTKTHCASLRESVHALAEGIAPLIVDPRLHMNYSSHPSIFDPNTPVAEQALDLEKVPRSLRIIVVTLTPERLAQLLYGTPATLHKLPPYNMGMLPNCSDAALHEAFHHAAAYWGLPITQRASKVTVNYVADIPEINSQQLPTNSAISRSKLVYNSSEGKNPPALDHVEACSFSFRPGDVLLFRSSSTRVPTRQQVRSALEAAVQCARTNANTKAEHLQPAQVCPDALHASMQTLAQNCMLFHAVGVVDAVHTDAGLRVFSAPKTKSGPTLVQHEYNVCAFMPGSLKSITQEGMCVAPLITAAMGSANPPTSLASGLVVMDPHIDASWHCIRFRDAPEQWRTSPAFAHALQHISYASNQDLVAWWNSRRAQWQTAKNAARPAITLDRQLYALIRDGAIRQTLISDFRAKLRSSQKKQIAMKLKMSVPKQLPRDMDEVITALLTHFPQPRIREWATTVIAVGDDPNQELTDMARTVGARLAKTAKNSMVAALRREISERAAKKIDTFIVRTTQNCEDLCADIDAFLAPIVGHFKEHRSHKSKRTKNNYVPATHASPAAAPLCGRKRSRSEMLPPVLGAAPVPSYYRDTAERKAEAVQDADNRDLLVQHIERREQQSAKRRACALSSTSDMPYRWNATHIRRAHDAHGFIEHPESGLSETDDYNARYRHTMRRAIMRQKDWLQACAEEDSDDPSSDEELTQTIHRKPRSWLNHYEDIAQRAKPLQNLQLWTATPEYSLANADLMERPPMVPVSLDYMRDRNALRGIHRFATPQERRMREITDVLDRDGFTEAMDAIDGGEDHTRSDALTDQARALATIDLLTTRRR